MHAQISFVRMLLISSSLEETYPDDFVKKIALQYPQLHRTSLMTQTEDTVSTPSLLQFLERRALDLKNADGSLHAQLDRIVQATDRWVRHDHKSNKAMEYTCTQAFIIDCPYLHMVSKTRVESHLQNMDTDGLVVSSQIILHCLS